MFSFAGMIKNCQKLFKIYGAHQVFFRQYKVIDRSHFPVLKEEDLEEHFIKGSGPGGSKVNSSINCVYLLHKPTGLYVKVHEHRELHLNRKSARVKLLNKLDVLLNKENSIENQKKEINFEKLKKKNAKQKKLLERKKNWKADLQIVND